MTRILLFLSSFIIVVGIAVAGYIGFFGKPYEVDRLRAMLGNGAATYRIGVAYDEGSSGATQDQEKARKWYGKAYKKGSFNAAFRLGVMMSDGTGGPADPQAALELFRAGAEAGHMQAMMRMARASFLGLGVEKNDAEGAAWVQKAAEAGSTEAMGLLGTLYYGGIGVEQNFDTAKTWLIKSGDPDAAALATNIDLVTETVNALPDGNRPAQWEVVKQNARESIGAALQHILDRDFGPGKTGE